MLTVTSEFIDQLAAAIVAKMAAKGAGRAQSTEGRLMSLEQAAAHLKRSPSGVRKLVLSGEIPPSVTKRIGKRLMFDRPELDRWISSQ